MRRFSAKEYRLASYLLDSCPAQSLDSTLPDSHAPTTPNMKLFFKPKLQLCIDLIHTIVLYIDLIRR
jgi:hypothetical protein